MLPIDCTTYDKARAWPTLTLQPNGRRLGRGYEARLSRPSQTLIGLVLHSTEHLPGQSAAGVWAYLRDSADVSTHYGVSPTQVVRVLDPGPWLAYHAGVSRWGPALACNLGFVGVELYHRAGGPDYAAATLAQAAALCRQLLADHPTIRRENIVLHRWVALPPGRKADPTDRDDRWWRAWIAAL